MSALPYFTPDRSAVGAYPSLQRRAAAGAIDWGLCYFTYLIVSIPLGGLQALGRVSWEAGDLRGGPGAILFWTAEALVFAPLVAYFALLWRSGSTLGMRAVDIELLAAGTGRTPSLWRTVPRAVLAVAFATAGYVLYFAIFSEAPLGGYSSTDLLVIYASVALFVPCILGKLWMLVDPARRTVWDRAFGFLYVEDLVPTDPARGSRLDLWLSRRAQ
ncbi:MAG: RDD family protein [Actinobacteria bacterium]|nr:RDD family protein [Actinomycetota bacterium]